MSRSYLSIGVAGGSGTGKSATLNALFGTRLDTSPTTTGTRNLATTDVVAGDSKVHLVDAPGLGDDARRDRAVLPELIHALAGCDVVLWVLSCRNRSLAADLAQLETLAVPPDRVVFGVNQVDLTEPADWNVALGLPSEGQDQNLLELLEDRRARLATALGAAQALVGYSATRAFRLQELFTALVAVTPPGKTAALRAAKTLRLAPFSRLDQEAHRQVAHQRRERRVAHKEEPCPPQNAR